MIYNCFILARKNSKRITNKNLIIFKGKPLIYWTLKQSIKLKNINKIIISSDSKKIRDIASKISKNILINKRPKTLSLSSTTSEKVMKYLIKKYKINKNKYILLLQPTSPLRNLSDISKILKIAERKKLNSIHSVSEYKGKKIIKSEINVVNKSKVNINNISFNGAIYLFKTDLLVKKNSIYESIQNVYITKKKYSLDIDNYSDLKNYKC